MIVDWQGLMCKPLSIVTHGPKTTAASLTFLFETAVFVFSASGARQSKHRPPNNAAIVGVVVIVILTTTTIIILLFKFLLREK